MPFRVRRKPEPNTFEMEIFRNMAQTSLQITNHKCYLPGNVESQIIKNGNFSNCVTKLYQNIIDLPCLSVSKTGTLEMEMDSGTNGNFIIKEHTFNDKPFYSMKHKLTNKFIYKTENRTFALTERSSPILTTDDTRCFIVRKCDELCFFCQNKNKDSVDNFDFLVAEEGKVQLYNCEIDLKDVCTTWMESGKRGYFWIMDK